MEERIMLMLEGISADMAKIKADMGELRVDAADLKTEIRALETRASDLGADPTEFRSDLALIKVGIEVLRCGQKRIEFRLENELRPKLNALYDQQRAASAQNTRSAESSMGTEAQWVPSIPALTALYNQVRRHEEQMKENEFEIQRLNRAVFS